MKDPTNVPVSRAVLRRNAQQQARQMSNTSPSPPIDCSILTSSDSVMTPSTKVSSIVAVHHATSANNDWLTGAKVLASKANVQGANTAKHMKKMEELEKGMALLKEMRPVIGNEMFANGFCSFYAVLPNFKGSDTVVDIIDVDAPAAINHITGNNNEWRTSKRCLSSGDDKRFTMKKKKRRKPTRSNAMSCIGDDAASIIGADVEDGNNFEDEHDCLEDDHEGRSEKSDCEAANGGHKDDFVCSTGSPADVLITNKNIFHSRK